MGEYESYNALRKPFWAPPAWVFMPVWVVLYVIIAWSFAFVFYGVVTKIFPLLVGLPFLLNLVFNFSFTSVAFRLKNQTLALIDGLFVLGTLVWGLLAVLPIWPPIVWVNIPYLLWLVFAVVLQIAVTAMNPTASPSS